MLVSTIFLLFLLQCIGSCMLSRICFVFFGAGGVSFKPGKQQQLYFECLSCVICKMLCFDVLYMALCVTLLNKSVCNMLNYIGREFYFVAYGCFYNIYSTGVYKSLLQII